MSGNVHRKRRGRDAMCSDGANPAAAIYTADGRKRVKRECLRAKASRPKGAGITRAKSFTRTRTGRLKVEPSTHAAWLLPTLDAAPRKETPKLEPTFLRPAARLCSRVPPRAAVSSPKDAAPVSVIRRFSGGKNVSANQRRATAHCRRRRER